VSKYCEAAIERAVELREQGLTYAAAAQRTGMSPGAVEYYCLKLGAEGPRDTPPADAPTGPMVLRRKGHIVRRFTSDEDRQMLEMESAGLARAEIARRLGRRQHSISSRLMTLARREAREEAHNA